MSGAPPSASVAVASQVKVSPTAADAKATLANASSFFPNATTVECSTLDAFVAAVHAAGADLDLPDDNGRARNPQPLINSAPELTGRREGGSAGGGSNRPRSLRPVGGGVPRAALARLSRRVYTGTDVL